MRNTCPYCNGTGYFGTGHFGQPRDLGNRLRDMRLKLGLHQAEVARQLGISRAMLCHMEVGRRPWTQRHAKAYEVCIKRKLKQLKGMLK